MLLDTIRTRTIGEIASMIADQVRDTVQETIDLNVRNCVTCKQFDQAGETCKLAGIRPPAKIIAYGCEQWQEIDPFGMDDEIPF